MNKQETRNALRMLRAALEEATDTENFDYQRGRQPSKKHADFVMRLKAGIEELEKELKGSKRNPRYLVSRDGKANPLEKSAEHPIEVTRHYRSGGPNYLSPWQRAMAIGQEELFDTGIQMLPRVAERRAALFAARNPGATKRAYESGLKEATAAQLARLVRVGLRVGLTMAEIKKDVDATGRFTAAQIDRAMDQARSAERRSNPQPWKIPRGYEAEYQTHSGKLNQLYGLALQFYSRQSPMKTPQFIADAHKLARLEIEELPYTFAKDYSGKPFDKLLEKRIREFKSDLLDKAKRRSNRNPPIREIFETFNGRPATKTTTVQAPRRTPARVAQLGRLRLIRTADGRTWRFPGERAPFLAADSRGKLHVVGGQYRANPAGEICGEIEQIEYQTSKPHLGHDNETIYYHQLGEETGERPILEITPEGELQIIGGDYRIEADGIHN